MKQTQGILLLSVFSLITGLTGYVVKSTPGLNPQQVLFFRATLASGFLLAIAVLTNRLHELKPRLPVATVIMGLVQGISIFFFYAALAKTTLTNSILLVYTAPIFSAILAGIFLKEKIKKQTIVAVLMSFLGVVLINNPSQFSLLGRDHLIGSVYALLGGFFYGAMAIASKNVSQKTTSLYAAFWQYFVIMLAFALFALPVPASAVSSNIWALLYLGIVAGGVAFLLFMKGIKLVEGQIIQVITMIEVLVATLSGVLLLGEHLSLPILAGGVLILSSVLIVAPHKKKTS